MAKLNKKEIQNLLSELYQTDPSLKKRESELVQLIMNMTASRPSIAIDDAFKEHLRKTLKTEAKRLATMPAVVSQTERKKSMSMLFPFVYGGGGLVVGALATFLIFQQMDILPKVTEYSPDQNQNTEESKNNPFSDAANQVTRLAKNAFGSIAETANLRTKDPSSASVSTLAAENATSQVTGMGGGGAGMATAPAVATDMRIAPYTYEAPNYQYQYTGEDLSLIAQELDVYRLIAEPFSAASISNAVRSLNLGIIDLGAFEQIEVSDFNLIENRDHGYSIYISPSNGTININQIWERWRDIYPDCTTNECWERDQRTITERRPADEAIIDTANAFLDLHGISISSYGAPLIDNRWKRYQAVEDVDGATEQKMIAYAPETVQVIYPYLVDGKEVVDTSGMQAGLVVGVQVRTNEVSYVNNLRLMKKEVSSYDAVSNTEEILSYLKQGGLYGEAPGKGEEISIELGTPEMKFVQIYQYDGNQNAELLVPALVFPITNKPQTNFWRTHLIVPLVKEILEEYNRPVPRPLLEMPVDVTEGAMIKEDSEINMVETEGNDTGSIAPTR